VRQDNKGAYGARNTGLDHATGELIAFFDSDDLWLPHHLEACVRGLDAAQDVDWIYAACRSVDAAGRIVQDSVFEPDGRPLPFLSLETKRIDAVRVIEDPRAVECQLSSGLYAGLQNSVIRRRVFDGHRFWADYRVVEDVLFLIRAMLRGVRLAYLTDVHVIYCIHDGNSSGAATGLDPGAVYRIRRESVEGLERIEREATLTPSERRALRRRLAHHYFWDIGYVCFLTNGDTRRALLNFKRGLALAPAEFRMWKTFLATMIRRMSPTQ
jgi:glycosyltransferase involved in cell wall biosynthesis